MTEAFAIPHTMIGRLSRDDAARFGLDRREFAESVWQFTEKPRPGIHKYFFVRTATDQPHYINGFVNLFCAQNTNAYYVMAYGRERLAGDVTAPAAPLPITINLNETQFRFSPQKNEKYDVRAARLASAALNKVSDAATMVLPAADFGRQQEPAADVTLSMAGLARRLPGKSPHRRCFRRNLSRASRDHWSTPRSARRRKPSAQPHFIVTPHRITSTKSWPAISIRPDISSALPVML